MRRALSSHGLAIALVIASVTVSEANTRRYRLALRDDPTTTMVIAWEQSSGSNPVVHYDTTDHGTAWASYADSALPHHTANTLGMDNRFVRLTGLLPDTAYYFVIRDSDSVSQRIWFRTAPAGCAEFTFVSGGDSRDNRTARRNANILVSRLRPLFVGFGGDYTFDDQATEWQEWMDDWQSTRSADGRMYPIVPTRGNHDSSSTVSTLFDTPDANLYYALSFGQTLLVYTLNTEIFEGGAQRAWLETDLIANGANHIFRFVQYHRPMRPHQSGKPEGDTQYANWAQLFYDHKVDLVNESDSHVLKVTWPIRPSTGPGSSEGFIRDDASGTVYIGEGGWGAPLRTYDDTKPWTRNGDSFNQFKWTHVRRGEMRSHTVRTANAASVGEVADTDPFAAPVGLDLWTPSNGQAVVIPSRSILPDSDGDGVPDSCDPCPIDNPDDSDLDGVCDSNDLCPGFPDNVDADGDGVPDGCDICAGFPDNQDADGDGVPDGCDLCAGFPDNQDADGDGVPDGCDICAGFPDNQDADADGVPDGCDICAGFPDNQDADGDGVPDGCDLCAGFPDNQDADGDGVPDGCDLCAGFPDNQDADADGVPDGCDICAGFPDNQDADGDGVPDGCDICAGFPDDQDADGDGVPDGCDMCIDFPDPIGPPGSGPGNTLMAVGDAELSWATVANAVEYQVFRGTIPARGLRGERPDAYDHTCLTVKTVNDHHDPDPPVGVVFYYLVAPANPCGIGSDGLGPGVPVPTCP